MLVLLIIILADDSQILGITAGGQTLNVAKKHFQKFLSIIVQVARLQVMYLYRIIDLIIIIYLGSLCCNRRSS